MLHGNLVRYFINIYLNVYFWRYFRIAYKYLAMNEMLSLVRLRGINAHSVSQPHTSVWYNISITIWYS